MSDGAGTVVSIRFPVRQNGVARSRAVPVTILTSEPDYDG